MSIRLLKPFNPGELDPENLEYTHAKITSFRMLLAAHQIDIEVQFGIETKGVFTSGVSNPTLYVIRDEAEMTREEFIDSTDPDKGTEKVVLEEAITAYSDLLRKSVTSGENLYDAGAKTLYEWLIEEQPRLAGTIE